MSHIIPKRVTMFELFYDLVFVYAIAKIAGMLHLSAEHAHLSWTTYAMFVAVCVIIMQIWQYQSVYINKYGKETISDMVGLCVTMFGAVFVANSINTTWQSTFVPFNFFMGVMSASIALQFILAHRRDRHSQQAHDAKVFIGILLLQATTAFISLLFGYEIGIWIAMAGYGISALIPTLLRSKMHAETLNFPHLAERTGLITIIIFGELMVHITEYFDVQNITALPAIIFTSVVLMFGTYVLCVERMMNHHQLRKGFLLMYAHFLVMIGLLTAVSAWGYGLVPEVARSTMATLMIGGLGLFYVSMYALSAYFVKPCRLTPATQLWLFATFVLAAVAMWISKDMDAYAFNLAILALAAVHFLTMWRVSKLSRAS